MVGVCSSRRQQTEEIKERHDWVEKLVTELGARSDQQGPNSPGQSSKLSDALDLTVTNQLLGALSRFSSSEFDRKENREFLPRLISTINGHFRERTRYQKLQFALRQYEEKQNPQNQPARPADSTATPGS